MRFIFTDGQIDAEASKHTRENIQLELFIALETFSFSVCGCVVKIPKTCFLTKHRDRWASSVYVRNCINYNNVCLYNALHLWNV